MNYSRSSDEIFTHIGVYNNTRARNKYIKELIFAGLLRPIYPKLNTPNQKYISTANNTTENDIN